MSFTTPPDVQSIALRLMNGSPLLKSATVIFEDLKVVKSLESGDIGSVLSNVLGSGLGAMMKNPLAGGLSSLTGSLGSAVQSLTGVDGMSGVLNAVNNMSSVVGNLSSLTNGLSGAAGGQQFSPLDMMAHVGMTGMLTQGVPDAISFATVMAPFGMASTLMATAASLTSVVADAVNGNISPSDAIDAIHGLTDGIAAPTTASTNALTAVQGATVVLATASAIGAFIATAPQDVQDLVTPLVKPDVLPVLLGAVAAIRA